MRDKIIQLLATKHSLSLKEVNKIVNSQFKCVSKVMMKGDFDPIRLPRFGLFRAKKLRIKYVTDAKRKSTGTGS